MTEILNWSKLKAFVSEIVQFALGRVENIVGNGKNADIFLPLTLCQTNFNNPGEVSFDKILFKKVRKLSPAL